MRPFNACLDFRLSSITSWSIPYLLWNVFDVTEVYLSLRSRFDCSCIVFPLVLLPFIKDKEEAAYPCAEFFVVGPSYFLLKQFQALFLCLFWAFYFEITAMRKIQSKIFDSYDMWNAHELILAVWKSNVSEYFHIRTRQTSFAGLVPA